MTSQDFFHFIQEYGYWIIYPLAIIEGPLVTLMAGSFSALGLLRWDLSLLVAILGEFTMDSFLYLLGRQGGEWLKKIINKSSKLKTTQQTLERFFKHHGGKTIFFVKITIGLSYITFITAGLIRFPYYRVALFSLLGGILWSGGLIILGYFYGHLYQKIAHGLSQAGFFIGGLFVLTLLVFVVYKKFKLQKIINGNH